MRVQLLNRIGFWLCLPIAALQGLRLRRTATRLPEATGDRTGAYGKGEAIHLLAIGDSIIAGVGTGIIERSLPVQFARALAERGGCRVHWHVDGYNGADIARLRRQVGRLAQYQKADVILISIGVNDVTGLSSTRYWRSQLEALVLEIKQAWPQARVMFAGLPPMGKFPLPPQPLRFTLGMRATTLDAIAAKVLSKEPLMLHVPTEIEPLEQEFCEDGFHPSAASCCHWAQELAVQFAGSPACDRTVSNH
jgi:lysophospholipase L1-like esterase